MISVLKSGGFFIIPIIICGFLANFIIIERIYYFISLKKKDTKFVKDLEEHLFSNDYEKCLNDCFIAQTPTSLSVKKAIESRRYAENDLREVVESEMTLNVPQFERFITPLGTIANIATLLGLLGTVTGNMKAFNVLGNGGTMGDPALLASAIAEALVTTVAGLCVSIPSLIFHNYFVSKVKSKIAEMEAYVTTVILKIEGRVK